MFSKKLSICLLAIALILCFSIPALAVPPVLSDIPSSITGGGYIMYIDNKINLGFNAKVTGDDSAVLNLEAKGLNRYGQKFHIKVHDKAYFQYNDSLKEVVLTAPCEVRIGNDNIEFCDVMFTAEEDTDYITIQTNNPSMIMVGGNLEGGNFQFHFDKVKQ
jgi:hypothetical protein